MNRREFSALFAAGATAASWLPAAQAQIPTPVEGTHYVKLNQPLPVAPGKIEVIEFFWYGCPHCNAFEPALDAWQKRLPADVAFRRVPVAFREEPFVAHQKIYYALEAMGLVPTMHRKVFYAIHGERQRLDKPAEIAAFMQKNGVDSAKFMENFNSFSTQTKARQAARLSEAYKIDGVPAIGIQGRYYTSGSLAGSPDASLLVADYLIQKVRKG
ncbi:MAG TPA: thiol:disulfide interchange protein DsbA/DsbL [Albitalea sp.]|nr:thiol:disulfide interchange protein DsbA/DsbL [Albitalea sp.]